MVVGNTNFALLKVTLKGDTNTYPRYFISNRIGLLDPEKKRKNFTLGKALYKFRYHLFLLEKREKQYTENTTTESINNKQNP